MVSQIILLVFSFLTPSLHAETIEFPDEEIATETVLPVFDRVETVKNRNIQLAKRFELGLTMGLALNQAYYNQLNFGGMLNYHLTESHAVNLVGIFHIDGLSPYGNDLKQGKGLSGGDTFDPSLAPHPQTMILANWQFTAYYGKISITKQAVMNLDLFGVLGVGYVSMRGTGSPALNLGFGQNFYFSNHLSLRLDLRMDIFQGPDPTTKQLNTGTTAPSASEFGNMLYTNTMLTAGLVYIL